jgi:hypothetical protein
MPQVQYKLLWGNVLENHSASQGISHNILLPMYMSSSIYQILVTLVAFPMGQAESVHTLVCTVRM